MMKVIMLVFCVVLVLSLTGFIRAQDEEEDLTLPDIFLAECLRINDDGSETITRYDVCTSFCCGGNVINNSTKQDCCGSGLFGNPYDPKNAHCCLWWTGHGKGHVKRYENDRIECCGANRISWGIQQCCYGFPDPPSVAYGRFRKCCNSNAVRIPPLTPSWALECCGDNAVYDRRTSSCPCMDGQILNVPRSQAECCETPEGLQTPIMTETQICCSGLVGEIGVNFCCGEGIGVIGDQVCCSGKLFDVVPRDVNKTECCNGEGYDPRIFICCDDELKEIIGGANQCCGDIPYNPNNTICCEGNTRSIESGSECCADQAFFPGKGSFCCNRELFLEDDVGGNACCGTGEDVVFYFLEDRQFICCNGEIEFRLDSDACCETTPYNSTTGVCCDGQVFDRSSGDTCCNGDVYFVSRETICCDDGPFGPFGSPLCCGGQGYDTQGGTVCCGDTVYGKYRWPACCVDVGYDAFTHTCCGANVIPVPNGSNNGTCCGINAIDQNTQLCCSGENVTIPKGIPRSRAECCDFEIYNTDTHLCCAGFIRNRTNRFSTQCCGTEAYNNTDQICCSAMDGTEPTLHAFEFGEETTACCGPVLYNTSVDYCCEGVLADQVFDNTGCCAGQPYNADENLCCENVLVAIGNVPIQRAECCGDKCMYGGVQRCCNDRIYQTNMLTNTTCQDF